MSNSDAPVLETGRLILRAFRAADLEPQAATLADPGVMRYLSRDPMSREEAWRRVLAMPGLWALLGYGYWAIEEKSSGTWLGQIGFADFKRDMEPGIEGSPEMGWILAPWAHGRGIASEAGAAALGWADQALAGTEVVAIIDPENRASIRVAEKLGFGTANEASYRGERVLLFRRSPR